MRESKGVDVGGGGGGGGGAYTGEGGSIDDSDQSSLLSFNSLPYDTPIQIHYPADDTVRGIIPYILIQLYRILSHTIPYIHDTSLLSY